MCAQTAGMVCALSTGAGFGAAFAGPAWSDAAGFVEPEYGRRFASPTSTATAAPTSCPRSTASSAISPQAPAGDAVAGPTLSDASGWADLDNASTIRLADVDADGDLDLCARANAGIRCWPWNGTGFDASFVGPDWNDASGWNDFRLYATIRAGDLDGDGRADLCGRGTDGVACHLSTGAGFGPAMAGPALADSVAGRLALLSTIRFAGPRPARCVQPRRTATASTTTATAKPTRVLGADADADAGSDSSPDGFTEADVAADAAATPHSRFPGEPGGADASGGCGCRVPCRPGGLGVALLLAPAFLLRRRKGEEL